jgi:hypothetical protein
MKVSLYFNMIEKLSAPDVPLLESVWLEGYGWVLGGVVSTPRIKCSGDVSVTDPIQAALDEHDWNVSGCLPVKYDRR